MKLIEFFQEDTGGLSMTRLCIFLVVSVVMGVFVFVAYHKGDMPDIPSGVQIFGGSVMALKLGQKFGERKDQS